MSNDKLKEREPIGLDDLPKLRGYLAIMGRHSRMPVFQDVITLLELQAAYILLLEKRLSTPSGEFMIRRKKA